MWKLAPAVIAAYAIACAGCLTTPRNGGYGDLSDSPVKKRLEATLSKIAVNALAPIGVPSVQGDGGGSHGGGRPEGWRSESKYHCVFRMVKGPPDWHQDRDKSWALPAVEYPRVIRAVYTDVRAAVEEAGGTFTDSEYDGSTFLVRYHVAASRGRTITGTVRGRVGPEKTDNHLPPLDEPYYSEIAVVVTEEAGFGM